MSEAGNWWGTVVVAEGEARYWRIGALDLFVNRLADGWLLQHFEHPRDDTEEHPLEVEREIAWMPENTETDVVQHKFPGSDGRLELRPRLADRAVVSRPRTPFSIAPGATVTVYVGSPLWLEILAGADQVRIDELPLMRPPQTWFGTSTFEGELCYAARTRCRTVATDLPRRPWRAISPLGLTNRGRDCWQLDRVVLPVPQMRLYGSPDGRLWTSALTTVRDPEGEVGDIRIGDAPPADAGPWTQLGEPRRGGSSSILGRFYGNLF